jgi:methylornithine synthase
MKKEQQRLDAILSRALQQESLVNEDIAFLLQLQKAEQKAQLFGAAKTLRRQYFGSRIFMYGFIYASTYCRNDCRFCFFRKSNPESQRYRKAKHEIVETALRLAESGVHLIDLTMGEDPALFNADGAGFDQLVELIKDVKQTTGLPVMISPGVVTGKELDRLARAGASWYACYQETHNIELFNQLRPGQDYDRRLAAKIEAHLKSLLIEEGLLCGVGETVDDIVLSIEMMRNLDIDQARVMRFVPQPGTPMEKRMPPDPQREMVISAVLRLVFPDKLIPASLDVDGLAGLKQRLEAGANVVTSIVPPGEGLAGVAQHSMDIEDGRRTNASVRKVVKACGLKAAGDGEYRNWVKSRLQKIDRYESTREAV